MDHYESKLKINSKIFENIDVSKRVQFLQGKIFLKNLKSIEDNYNYEIAWCPV